MPGGGPRGQTGGVSVPLRAVRRSPSPTLTCSATSTDTSTAPGVGLDDAVATDRPWVVVVWNDPINLMSYVTLVFQKLFGYSLEKATTLMLDVHEKGRASVFHGTREEAEMYVFRLHEHSLWATMEHDA